MFNTYLPERAWNLDLKTSEESKSVTSLGCLFHWLITFTVKNVSLIFKSNLPSFSVQLRIFNWLQSEPLSHTSDSSFVCSEGQSKITGRRVCLMFSIQEINCKAISLNGKDLCYCLELWAALHLQPTNAEAAAGLPDLSKWRPTSFSVKLTGYGLVGHY